MGIGFGWFQYGANPMSTVPQIAAMAFADPEPFSQIAPWQDMSDWEVDMLWILQCKINQIIEFHHPTYGCFLLKI